MTQARLPFPYRTETDIVAQALAALQGALDWPAVISTAAPTLTLVPATAHIACSPTSQAARLPCPNASCPTKITHRA